MSARTFATYAPPGTFLGAAADGGTGLVVGRAVANGEFMRALVRHGLFDRFAFFVGEGADVGQLEATWVATGVLAPERMVVHNLLALPEALAAGAVDVFHLLGFGAAFSDLIWLRDRHATRALPVTAQIHSLSYPRFMADYLRTHLHPPGPADAIICSSEGGRAAVARSLADAAGALGAIGARVAADACALPVIPLGVELDRLGGGDRARTRQRLGLPAAAPVVLGMGRFTEYDKMDLFPLLQAFRAVVDRINDPAARPYLLLAGARQGTKTPEMVSLWAKMHGIADRVVLEIDFPESEKPHLLAAADVFVAPSDNLQETFGLSVIEAMAAGLPVVASDFVGYKDTVSEEVGVRVPTRFAAPLDRVSELSALLYERPLHLLLGQSVEIDLPALEEALHTLVVDGRTRARLGANARERVQSHYDWRVVIPRYEALWHQLGQAPAPRRPAGARPPLAMDFAGIFGGFPTGSVDPERVVGKTALAARLTGARNQYLIYPELRNVFGDQDVLALLALCERPRSLTSLAAADAELRPGLTPWRRAHAIAWLLKHGLLS